MCNFIVYGLKMPSIEKSIADLQAVTKKLESEYSLELMVDATKNVEALFQRLNDLNWSMNKNDQKNFEELQEFIKRMNDIVKSLQMVSEGKIENAPEPNKAMHDFAEGFDKFISSFMSKRNQENLRMLIQYVPVIKDIVFYAESIPYYWHHANTQEKVGMVLSVVITAAAVAVGIAGVCSPAIAALPVIGAPMFTLLACGRSLFNAVIENPKKEFHELEQTKQNKERLDEISKVINATFETTLKTTSDLSPAENNPAPSAAPIEQSAVQQNSNDDIGIENTKKALFTPASDKTLRDADKKFLDALETAHECAGDYFTKNPTNNSNKTADIDITVPKRLQAGWKT